MPDKPVVPAALSDLTPEPLAAVEDWTLSSEFEWNGHHTRAHIHAIEPGVWFIQIEDLDAYEVVICTSHAFRMPQPMLHSVKVHSDSKLLVAVVNQKKQRLIAKELLTLKRNTYPTPPVEEQPVEG